MTSSSLKSRLAGALIHSAKALAPAHAAFAPTVLLTPSSVPQDEAARAPIYDLIAYSAIAWMMMVDTPRRAAAASIIKRNYPGIEPYMDKAYKAALAFDAQLKALILAEQTRYAEELAKADIDPEAVC